MIQGYTQQDRGSKGGWASNLGSGRAEAGKPFPRTIFYSNEAFRCSYTCGVAHDQWTASLPEKSKLSRIEAPDRETGGSMLSVTGINRFYYLRDFTDMRCKHSRVVSIIREQLHREPNDGDVFMVIIEQKQELLARESISRPALDYSEGMTAEEQKRYINYLAERVREADLGLRARDAVLQDFLDKQKEYDECLSKLDDVLSKVSSLEKSLKEKERKLKSAERKVADLTAKLKFADKNRFGDKRQKVKKAESTKAEESDRGKDENDFDGTSSSLPDNSVSKNEAFSKEENPSKKERDLSNRPETYKTMCVKGPSGKQRQSLETKGILINIRTHLCIEKSKDPATVTPNLQKALNYLDTFWTNLFTYIKDGSYPIDNNAAERAVRPLTTQRNSMLHFGSDKGAKMVATYHSIISTVKLQGRSVWNYLGKFFVNIFNGCRDFFSLWPGNIGLATCQ